MPDELTVDRVTYRRVNGDWRRLSGSNVTHGVTDAVAALLDHLAEKQDEEDES